MFLVCIVAIVHVFLSQAAVGSIALDEARQKNAGAEALELGNMVCVCVYVCVCGIQMYIHTCTKCVHGVYNVCGVCEWCTCRCVVCACTRVFTV